MEQRKQRESDKDMKTLKKTVGTAALLLLSLVCLLTVVLGSHQSVLSKPSQLCFSGEYSRDGESWQPLHGADFSCWEGDLYLRGHFDLDIPKGLRISWYRNHIGVSMAVNGENMGYDIIAMYSQEGEPLTPDVCGSLWDYQLSPGIAQEDMVEFHLYDPHRYGNGRACQEFLDNLYVSGNTSIVLEGYLKPYSTPLQGLGLGLIIVALLVLGAALASVLMHTPLGVALWNDAFLCLFAGGFVYLDTVNISFISELVVFNTYGKLLCGMLAVYFGQLCLCEAFTGRRRTLANAALLASALLDCVLVVLSFTEWMVLYDGLFPWRLSQLALSPLLMGCAAAELRRNGKNRRTLISGLLLMAAVLLDLTGLGASMYSHGSCSKLVFLLLFVSQIITTVKHIVLDHRGSLRAGQLEKELEDSRICSMLSQMQPHFLYNVLNSIYQLCEVDPKTAQDAIEKFSDYLRSNMASLEQKELIPFEEEYSHVQTYLALEQIRFPATLRISEDIQAANFKVPPLTVQVLVENAVKHGVTKKRGGGTVTVATRELPDCWQITVSDTGKGFDSARYEEDGKAHFGLRNVRERLRLMADGTLTVMSVPGQGTTAEIRIPKGGKR